MATDSIKKEIILILFCVKNEIIRFLPSTVKTTTTYLPIWHDASSCKTSQKNSSSAGLGSSPKLFSSRISSRSFKPPFLIRSSRCFPNSLTAVHSNTKVNVVTERKYELASSSLFLFIDTRWLKHKRFKGMLFHNRQYKTTSKFLR